MERTPGELRRLGLERRLRARPGLATADLRDAGDATTTPAGRPTDDPRAKNRALIVRLPAAAGRPHGRGARGAAASGTRLLALGGDCTTHAGVMAGIRRARPGPRSAIVWFDAHGDFNTPDTTPSGNVWGMPFAMILGRGEPDLLAACDGPSALEEDAALLGGQVLDETESRMLAASRVAHFGAGMLGTDGWPGGPRGLGADGRVARRRVLRRVRSRRPRRLRRLGAGDARAGWDVARDGGRGDSRDPAAGPSSASARRRCSSAAAATRSGRPAAVAIAGRGGARRRRRGREPAAYWSSRRSLAAIAVKSFWLMPGPGQQPGRVLGLVDDRGEPAVDRAKVGFAIAERGSCRGRIPLGTHGFVSAQTAPSSRTSRAPSDRRR